jgi:hypothetical protein
MSNVSAFPVELTAKAERAMAPLWLSSLRAPQVQEEFDQLGLDASERYFPARAAPLGSASLELVVATFFNFSPRAVARAIPSAWDKATPGQILDAQLTGVDRALRRAFAPLDDAVVAESLALLRRAAEAAMAHPEGRPLFAGYASLPWPDEPHLALWHAHYLLREFRGDGHIAVLVAEGLSGVEALALHIAMMPAIGALFRQSRAWTDDEWGATIDSLRADGWLTSGGELALSADGAKRREAIERHTDELALPAYLPVGGDGCARIVELGRILGSALEDAGLGFTLPR